MKVFLSGAYRWPWYEEACAGALEALGHDVVRFRWDGYFSGLMGRLQNKLLLGPAVTRLNEDLVAAVLREAPDVTWIWRGLPIREATVHRLRTSSSSALVSYNNDDPFGPAGDDPRLKHFKRSIPHFHLHYVYREVNVVDFRAAGAKSVAVLLPYYVPALHHPVELMPTEQERYGCDVAFVGHYEDDGRAGHLLALLDAGLDLKVYGPDSWRAAGAAELVERVGPIRPVLGQEYAKAIAGARLCLNLLSRRNRDTYTRRCFEIPACGGLLLSERTDDLRAFFEEDREAVYFASSAELVEAADSLLAEPDRRRAIAAAGRERCVRDGHDVVSRMRSVVSDFLELTPAAA